MHKEHSKYSWIFSHSKNYELYM